MTIVCQNCSNRFPMDEELGGAHQTICRACARKSTNEPPNPALEKGALSLGGSPSTDSRRYERTDPAPEFEVMSKPVRTSNPEAEQFVQMLARLVGQSANAPAGEPSERPSWKPRKALLCGQDQYREKVARMLNDAGYQVFVAVDTKQAVERMREDQMDVVLLDPQFDHIEQGAAFVVREVNVLRPAQRRRLFFVLLSPSLRTLDAHGAFLNNVNAIVNLKELDELTQILNQALRGYNELYEEFNQALSLSAI